MQQTRYLVVMEELHADGWVVRRMLCARFVAKGDAIAYAIWRRDTQTGTQFRWIVETPNAVHSLFDAEPNLPKCASCSEPVRPGRRTCGRQACQSALLHRLQGGV